MNLKPYRLLACIVIGGLLFTGGIFPTPAHAETVVRIGGTGSALGTIKLLAGAYERSHPGVRIQILPSLGITGGIKALLSGSLDLALASRPLTATEQHQGAVGVEYARSPFIFISNAKTSKKDLSSMELENIYAHPAAKWPDGSRIRLVLRPDKDLSTQIVRSISPAMDQAVTLAMARPGMIMGITDQEATDIITRTPGALGGSTLCEIISENRSVNILSFNGVQPSVKTIADKTYPLFKQFLIVTTAKSPSAARYFAEFIRSPAAAAILLKSGNLTTKIK